LPDDKAAPNIQTAVRWFEEQLRKKVLEKYHEDKPLPDNSVTPDDSDDRVCKDKINESLGK
jgi:hypothetical protein